MSLFLTLSTPVLAFAGALLGVLLNRRSAREVETRSRREETMRSLRWAADHAVDESPAKAALGVAELRALGRSALLHAEQTGFVDAALSVVIEDREEWD